MLREHIGDIGRALAPTRTSPASTPGATWKAIEAWAPYIAEHGLWQKDDHVIVADVRHVDLQSITYAPDLVIIGDVLECLPRRRQPAS